MPKNSSILNVLSSVELSLMSLTHSYFSVYAMTFLNYDFHCISFDAQTFRNRLAYPFVRNDYCVVKEETDERYLATWIFHKIISIIIWRV